MTSWFGNQWGKFLSSMPENIGVFAVIFFLLFIAVSALFSLTKRFMQNIAALAAAIVSAFVSFLLVDSIYGILLKREGIQAAINELLEKFPELGASSEGVVAVSKFVVSLVAVPALFLIVYGIFSLVTSIIFRKYQKEGVSGGKKAESNISSTVKIIIGVLSGVAAFVAYFFPSHSFVDLMTLPPILITAFAVVKGIMFFFGKHRPKADWARKTAGIVSGAATGLILFVMLMFPFLSLANIMGEGVSAIPEEALACYENAEVDESSDDVGVMTTIFSYTAKAKVYSDSYSKTFVSKIYPKCGVAGLHNKVAPEKQAESILKATVALGSYYYCEEQGAEFADADERLGEYIDDVIGDKNLNDVLQALFCDTISTTFAEENEGDAFRQKISATAKLSELENLDEQACAEESVRLSRVYQVLCKMLVSKMNKRADGFTPDDLILIGNMLDAMNDTYSFGDTPVPIINVYSSIADKEEILRDVFKNAGPESEAQLVETDDIAGKGVFATAYGAAVAASKQDETWNEKDSRAYRSLFTNMVAAYREYIAKSDAYAKIASFNVVQAIECSCKDKDKLESEFRTCFSTAQELATPSLRINTGDACGDLVKPSNVVVFMMSLETGKYIKKNADKLGLHLPANQNKESTVIRSCVEEFVRRYSGDDSARVSIVENMPDDVLYCTGEIMDISPLRIAKFDECGTDNIYFRNYKQALLNAKNYATDMWNPHIGKDLHRRGYLPYMNEANRVPRKLCADKRQLPEDIAPFLAERIQNVRA